VTAPRVVVGRGARYHLCEHVAGRILVVASPRALRSLPPDEWASGRPASLFSDFQPNPRLSDVLVGCRQRDDWRPDVIVAIGGGSTIDVAKMIRLLPADADLARATLGRPAETEFVRPLPLVALPTTAGSGSEVTQFATVYVDGAKRSLDHARARPDIAIVDPDLSATCPPEVASSARFDTICHAVESYWSRRSTPASREHSRAALRSECPATAAVHAGRAIDITRTTAAHAFSYYLTARHGVPHGVACLLNLQWLFDYNESLAAAADRRAIEELADLLDPHGTGVRAVLGGLLVQNSWSPALRDYGVDCGELPAMIAAGIGVGDRAGNNPVPLHPDLVGAAVSEIF
jgi:alcohol dehydrogenase